MPNIGAGELLIIALIALLLFGAGRIADIGKGLGEGIKNFKKGLRDDGTEGDKQLPESTPKPPSTKSDD
jgi:sec-independent protein translocase protein TatA